MYGNLEVEERQKDLCRAIRCRPIAETGLGSSRDDTSLAGSADMFQLNIRLIITVFLNTAIPRSSVFCCWALEHTEIKQTA